MARRPHFRDPCIQTLGDGDGQHVSEDDELEEPTACFRRRQVERHAKDKYISNTRISHRGSQLFQASVPAPYYVSPVTLCSDLDALAVLNSRGP